ncbi:MAG: glycosyltransferase family 4 protein [Haloarculaceae archaeon]
MRVAFVAMETTHRRDTQGTRRLQRLARLLADRGHEVRVYCTQWWDGGPGTVVENGVFYHGVVDSLSPTLFSLRVASLLPGMGADVVHASPRPPVGVLAARAGGVLARAPLVVEWFGDEDVAASRLRSWAATAPARVIVPSEMVRTRVREYGTLGENTQMIPESIDVEHLRQVDPAEDAPDIVYAHPMDDDANVESLLLALAELRDRDWSAAIVGDGPKRRDYQRQATDLRIDDRVSFPGEQSADERLALYRGAHVFVQTARRAYFATDLLEALAAGCVGIVEYQAESSAHELIENYERSFRVTSPEELADAIVDAGRYPRTDFVESFERYDHEAVVAEYLECYRELRAAHGVL